MVKLLRIVKPIVRISKEIINRTVEVLVPLIREKILNI